MARRRKDNTFEIARAIGALALVGMLLASGGDIKKAAAIVNGLSGLMLVLLFVIIGVAVVGGLLALIWLIVRPRETRTAPSQQQAKYTSPTPAEKLPIVIYAPPSPPPPKEFTEELLKKLDWRRFELLVRGLFKALGFHAERVSAGADGGIDLVLRESEFGPLAAIVQAKQWTTWTVSPDPIRALYGVMIAEGAPHAYFVISGRYSQAALDWAKDKAPNHLTLVNGKELALWLNSLESTQRDQLMRTATEGDFQTPSCPKCEIPMRLVTNGPHGDFWGCPNFSRRPSCRRKIKVPKGKHSVAGYPLANES